MGILLVLLKHWWNKPDSPYLSKQTIGDTINRSRGTAQTHVRGMEDAKLIKRKKRFHKGGGQSSNEYDLSGLIEKLTELAKEELAEKQTRKDIDDRKRRGKGS